MRPHPTLMGSMPGLGTTGGRGIPTPLIPLPSLAPRPPQAMASHPIPPPPTSRALETVRPRLQKSGEAERSFQTQSEHVGEGRWLYECSKRVSRHSGSWLPKEAEAQGAGKPLFRATDARALTPDTGQSPGSHDLQTHPKSRTTAGTQGGGREQVLVPRRRQRLGLRTMAAQHLPCSAPSSAWAPRAREP